MVGGEGWDGMIGREGETMGGEGGMMGGGVVGLR